MNTWNCCRTCLGVQSLYPIFSAPEHSEKYTEVILTATGVKVELNDSLPQEICSTCITFINSSYKFRKKCEENQKVLLDRTNDKHSYKIKLESNNIKSENGNYVIDILDLVNDKSFNDNENGINNFTDSIGGNDDQDIEFDTKVQEIVEKPVEPIFKEKKSKRKVEKPVRRTLRSKKESGEKTEVQEIVEKPVEPIFKEKKSKRKVEKPVRRTLRSKKESGEKTERTKEEIECEHCHKILTSKLSLRNHYKIHTGFDVVCEHCGKKFITRRLLLMHCRAKHGYEKTDKCSYCDYRASNAEQVKIHERLHTGEKPYVCSSCGADFHRQSSYLQHIAIHLPDKTVQCDQCPARFKSVTLMRIHKNRHRAPQYSFKCRVCENSFARRRNVARHLQRIHGLQPTHEHIDRLKIA